MTQAPEVNQIIKYMDPDTGRLTTEGIKMMAALIAAVKSNEARITALEP